MKPVKAWAVVHYKTRKFIEGVYFVRDLNGCKLNWDERWCRVEIREAKSKRKQNMTPVGGTTESSNGK